MAAECGVLTWLRNRPSTVRNGATRALCLPLSAIAAFGVARLTLNSLGFRDFGVATMIVALPALLPFADLGIGAAVTTAAVNRNRPDELFAVLKTSFRILSFVAAIITILALLITLAGAWPILLGVPAGQFSHLGAVLMFASVIFAISIPLSLGQRLLIGLDQYRTVILAQTCIPFLTIFVLLLTKDVNHFLGWFVLIPLLSQLVVAALVCSYAVRTIHVRSWALPTETSVSGRGARGLILSSAGPMTVITIGLPVALQSDRLLLSHLGTAGQLSEYALGILLYAPLLSVLTSAGVALWPRFALIREGARGRAAYLRSVRYFGLVGAIAAVSLVVAGPRSTSFWSGTHAHISLLWFAFGALLLVQTLHMPGGMFLTRPDELRFQAFLVALMLVLNLPLSVFLISVVGSAGPVLASAVAVAVTQLIPCALRIGRSPAYA